MTPLTEDIQLLWVKEMPLITSVEPLSVRRIYSVSVGTLTTVTNCYGSAIGICATVSQVCFTA